MKDTYTDINQIIEKLSIQRDKIITSLYENLTSNKHYTTIGDLYAIEEIIYGIENEYITDLKNLPMEKILEGHYDISECLGEFDYERFNNIKGVI